MEKISNVKTNVLGYRELALSCDIKRKREWEVGGGKEGEAINSTRITT